MVVEKEVESSILVPKVVAVKEKIEPSALVSETVSLKANILG